MRPILPITGRTYRGMRRADGCRVYVEAEGVSRRVRHVVYHSPTGLEWGYGGSGPADTSRSILADFLGFDPAAALYQAFKFRIVAGLAHEGWTLTQAEIVRALEQLAGEMGVECIRCMDDHEITDGRRVRMIPCPVCRRQPAPDDDAPAIDEDQARREERRRRREHRGPFRPPFK